MAKDGWSFALGRAIDERPADLSRRLPGRVLAFIPDDPDPEQASLQHRKIDACLGNLWSDKPQGQSLHSQRVRQWPPPASMPVSATGKRSTVTGRHGSATTSARGCAWTGTGNAVRSKTRSTA